MTGNFFLDGLGPVERAAVLSLASQVQLCEGQVLAEEGEPLDEVHFPVSAQISNIASAPDGVQLETSIIGREGLSGLAPFMADAPAAWRVVCSADGSAFRISADALRELSDKHVPLRYHLLALTHFYQAQSNQLALCSTHHRSTERLARWLLITSDLTQRTHLHLTQEKIALALGLQRTSVVASFGTLKAAGAIRHMRTRLEIIDRESLIRQACGCYSRLHNLAMDLKILPRNR